MPCLTRRELGTLKVYNLFYNCNFYLCGILTATAFSFTARRLVKKQQSNLCSSVNIKNVSDVINAANETKRKLCNSCVKCTVIKQIYDTLQRQQQEQQQEQIQQQIQQNSADVYEFDAQTDERVAPFSQCKRRNKNEQGRLDGNEELFNKLLQQLSTAPNIISAQRHKKKKPKRLSAKSPMPSTSRGSAPKTASERLAALRSNYISPLIQMTQEEKRKSVKPPTSSHMVEAPTFYLTEAELNVSIDLIKYNLEDF